MFIRMILLIRLTFSKLIYCVTHNRIDNVSQIESFSHVDCVHQIYHVTVFGDRLKYVQKGIIM